MPVKSKSKTNKPSDSAVVAAKKSIQKRVCVFCEGEKEPSFTDSATLRKLMSDRSRIVPRAKSGVCSKHQRAVTANIKYARHLALLPFVNKA